MVKNQLSWMIGGPQGSGINLSAELLAKALCRGGLHVFGNIEYHSNIKGKHSYYRLTISHEPVSSHVDEVDLLVALDEETLFGDLYHEYPAHRGHVHEVVPGGGIIYDSKVEEAKERVGRDDVQLFAMPYLEILDQALAEFGKAGQAREYQIMKNTLALGASAGILQYDFERLAEVIRESFKGRTRLADLNVAAAKHAHHYAREHFSSQVRFRVEPEPSPKKQILLKGIHAVAIGKLKAGCGFQTYYPISPATDESVYLEEHQREYPMVIVQTEDEVSAIDMAVMAAHAGARAATSTSGPGFALMPEGLGFAAMTEAPGPVVCIYQRGGPSTGMPTRHEQGDLRFALHAGQGDFPKIVLASGDVEECFYDAFDSFNYAECYQVPVILLLDKHLASSYVTLPPFDVSGLTIHRGALFQENPDGRNAEYLRYQFTERGITPRSIPGQNGGIFWTTTDEHDQKGHITEGIGNRIAIMQKRMKKLELAAQEIPQEKMWALHGPKDAPITIVSWGSTKGAILDTLKEFDREGQFNFLQIRFMSPFPVEAVTDILKRASRTLCIEGNYGAQLAGLIREKTGIEVDHKVVKYDGRPFSRNEIRSALEAVLKRASPALMVSEGKVRPLSFGIEEVNGLLEVKRTSKPVLPPVVPSAPRRR